MEENVCRASSQQQESESRTVCGTRLRDAKKRHGNQSRAVSPAPEGLQYVHRWEPPYVLPDPPQGGQGCVCAPCTRPDNGRATTDKNGDIIWVALLLSQGTPSVEKKTGHRIAPAGACAALALLGRMQGAGIWPVSCALLYTHTVPHNPTASRMYSTHYTTTLNAGPEPHAH